VTGYSVGSGTRSYATIMYDASGQERWVSTLNSGNGYDEEPALVVSSSGECL
jgi:hypothetical protein